MSVLLLKQEKILGVKIMINVFTWIWLHIWLGMTVRLNSVGSHVQQWPKCRYLCLNLLLDL